MRALFQRAAQERPLKNFPIRLAAATSIGTFELLDYLIVTSDTVGEGLRQFARYVVLVAPSGMLIFYRVSRVVNS